MTGTMAPTQTGIQDSDTAAMTPLLHRNVWGTSEALLAIDSYELIQILQSNATSIGVQFNTITGAELLAQQHQALVVPCCSSLLVSLLPCSCLSSFMVIV
jgi:hypothetical protein